MRTNKWLIVLCVSWSVCIKDIKMIRYLLVILGLVFLFGCASSPGVVPMEDGSNMNSRSEKSHNTTVARAKDDQAKADQKYEDTLKLLQVTGSLAIGEKLGIHLANQSIETLKKQKPEVSPRAFSVIQEETINWFEAGMDPDGDLIKDMVLLYCEYYSHEEILQLIAFYETDLGRKIISFTPEIMDKSLVLGQAWAQNNSYLLKDKILTRFKKEGIKID
ncbi:MAG: hypothetical protein VR65_12305 [Desulfobulbaceae bacterium BRH_c16a]|nr:MAG: hypothetical protein VR65_12305 [Desulfobulbaceae bacterium BRH_c16a]